jgi:ATP phosphoribosyltransferase
MLTVALPKGKLLRGAVAALLRAGLAPEEDVETTRRLILGEAGWKPVRFVLLKDADVPLYVERGVADCGIVGTDQLRESGASLLEPLDLGFGRCRLVIAAAGDAGRALEPPPGRSLRVATRFARLAAEAFAARAVPVDILKVSGSVELAAVTGLADCIVDLVETGKTLAANGLTERETILHSSARAVVNRAAFRLKNGEVRALLEALEKSGEAQGAAARA